MTAVVGVLLGLAPALAAGEAAAQWRPKAQGNRIGIETDVMPADFAKVLGWDFLLQIELVRGLHLDVEVPWAYVFDASPGTPDGFVFGNPGAGLHYAGNVSRNVGLWGGGTVHVTTAWDPNGFQVERATAAAVSHALYDLHRFWPEYVFVRPRGGIEARMAGVVYYRGEIAPVIWVPVGEHVRDPELVLEHASEIEGRADVGVGGGGRVQLVFPFSEGNDPRYADDVFQAAVEPYFTYEPDEGFYARVGLLVALDRPLGFGFDRGGVYTFRVAMGGKWD